jgi:dTDP-glucose 4,6-dehydratase
MNLLVTGGAGFIGSNFIRLQLHDEQALVEKLVNLDKLTYAGNEASLSDLGTDSRYQFVRGDIGDSEQVASLLRDHAIDVVANFAAESHVDRSIDSPEPFFQTNVIGTLRLLDASRKYWRSLPDEKRSNFRFLHVSTDEVYGSLELEDPAFHENTPYAPNSPYSASKAGSDHIVRAYFHTYGMPVVTTNCSNNYGPFQFPEKLIPLMILNALDGKALPIYGDGANIRDWLYVEDHCRAIALVLKEGRLGETYNIGGLNEMKNIEIVDTICRLLDARVPRNDGQSHTVLKTFVKDRPGHDRRYAIDCTKITREFGWKPLESFETGIVKTVDWYLANRSWCDDITTGNYARERLGVAG